MLKTVMYPSPRGNPKMFSPPVERTLKTFSRYDNPMSSAPVDVVVPDTVFLKIFGVITLVAIFPWHWIK